MTTPDDSTRFITELAAIDKQTKDRKLAKIVRAIEDLKPGIVVKDDGDIHMQNHTKVKLTVEYPDGSKGTLITRAIR